MSSLRYAIGTGCGPNLTLLHGWGMRADIFAPFAMRMASRFTIQAPDLPGYGLNIDCKVDEDIQATATRIAENLPDSSLLLGWSLGGLVAIDIARRYPDRVSKLILVASNPCFIQQQDWQYGLPRSTFDAFADSLEQSYAQTLKRFLALQFHGIKHSSVYLRDLKSQLSHPKPASQTLHIGLAWLCELDLRAALCELSMPVQCILGARDRLVPVALHEGLRQLASPVHTHIIDDASHLPFLTHAQAFDQALLKTVASDK